MQKAPFKIFYNLLKIYRILGAAYFVALRHLKDRKSVLKDRKSVLKDRKSVLKDRKSVF